MASPTCKGRCQRPHEIALEHWPSPPSNNGRYGKPEESVTGSTHANHRSASSPRPTPEGPARDNPIAGPQTGTTRSEPSAPASAGASGRHNEPGSRPASACPAQPPINTGAKAPGMGKRTTASGKATGAPRATRPDEARCTTRGHEARERGTPPATTRAHGQVPGNNGRRVPQTRTVRATTTQPRPRSDTEGEARPSRHRDRTPRTGSSGADQAAGTAAPRTAATRDQRRWVPRTVSSGAEQAAGATGSQRGGHEDEAARIQQSGVEDEAGEKRRKQEEDKAKVTRRSTQVDQDGGPGMEQPRGRGRGEAPEQRRGGTRGDAK